MMFIRNFVLKFAIVAILAVSANASNFIDAETIAKQNGAMFRWFPVQKSFVFINKLDTTKFVIGMPYVSIKNKIENLKSAPQISGGHILLDSADVYVLFKKDAVKVAKPKNETAGTREVKTIIIDPGHGGKDSGALGKKSQEKNIVLSVGLLLKKELEKNGFNVKLTRDKDVFVELGQRANLANQWDGDLFISLHCNAIDAKPERLKQIKGFHVYVLRAPESEEDKAIARRENKVATMYGEKNAKEELSPLEWFKLEARLEKYKQNSYMFTEELLKALDGAKIKRQGMGVGGAGFMVLVGALMPAVLFEIGFITNPDDESYMISTKGQNAIAKDLARAIINYKSAVHSYRETLDR